MEGLEKRSHSKSATNTTYYIHMYIPSWSILLSARSGLFLCLPDLVYFTVLQIWSISQVRARARH